MTRACPFTKIVRCVWTCDTSCSPELHWTPSTVAPVAALCVVANAGPFGIGTGSGPGVAAGGWTRRIEEGIASVFTLTPRGWPQADAMAFVAFTSCVSVRDDPFAS